MNKQYDINQLADQYAKSLTGETHLFEQFLVDYFEVSPDTAFKNLADAGASNKTRQCAEDFNYNFLEQNLASIQQELENEQRTTPTINQAKVIQGFFRDYFETGNFGAAWENVQKIVNQDPELRNDHQFQNHLKKIAEHVRPNQKERKEINMQEDEAVFFKFRPGLPKRFEHKLLDYQVMNLMEDTLKKFYGALLPENKRGKARINVNHEVESIYKKKQLPLALQLAHADTLNRTSKTTVEIRELNTNFTQIKKLMAQDVKFKFTDADLKKAVQAHSSLPRPKTATERVDIIRNLIIDLQSRPTNDAFKEAIKRATDCGDKDLLKVLEKNLPVVERSRTLEGQANMLLDGYKLYIIGDITLFKDDALIETKNLINGMKSESVKLALDELEKKGEALVIATAYNRVLRKALHSSSAKDFDKSRNNTLADEVEAIAKKTSIRVDIENARKQPPPSQNQGPNQGLESHFN